MTLREIFGGFGRVPFFRNDDGTISAPLQRVLVTVAESTYEPCPKEGFAILGAVRDQAYLRRHAHNRVEAERILLEFPNWTGGHNGGIAKVVIRQLAATSFYWANASRCTVLTRSVSQGVVKSGKMIPTTCPEGHELSVSPGGMYCRVCTGLR